MRSQNYDLAGQSSTPSLKTQHGQTGVSLCDEETSTGTGDHGDSCVGWDAYRCYLAESRAPSLCKTSVRADDMSGKCGKRLERGLFRFLGLRLTAFPPPPTMSATVTRSLIFHSFTSA